MLSVAEEKAKKMKIEITENKQQKKTLDGFELN